MSLTLKEIAGHVAARKPVKIGGNTKGLSFVIAPSGRPHFELRYMLKGVRRVMTISNAVPTTPKELKEIELLAEIEREKVKRGIDPLEERRQSELSVKATVAVAVAKPVVTFKTVALDYIDTHRDGWKNPKHRAQWKATLETYAFPSLGKMEPHAITTEDVLKVLRPIWNTKRETAARVRSRIETVIGAAKAKGVTQDPVLWRGHINPARWSDGLEYWLTGKQVKGHHPAMPWEELPAFHQMLTTRTDYSSKALTLLILTATRTNETLGAQWSEIALENAIWTIPAERMKAGREHRVPLSPAAVGLLEKLPRLHGNPFVFPGAVKGKGLSNMALLMVMRGMELGHFVPHGFRSSFRDWAAEMTGHPTEVAEMALAHSIKDKVEAAYRRGELLEKRRLLMNDWSKYLSALQPG